MKDIHIIRIQEHPELIEQAAEWFHQKCGALLHHRVVGFAVHHRHSGGHQQGGSQLAAGLTQLHIQLVLLDVLHEQRSHTGDLGRSHGGTGIVLISSAAGP